MKMLLQKTSIGREEDIDVTGFFKTQWPYGYYLFVLFFIFTFILLIYILFICVDLENKLPSS